MLQYHFYIFFVFVFACFSSVGELLGPWKWKAKEKEEDMCYLAFHTDLH